MNATLRILNFKPREAIECFWPVPCAKKKYGKPLVMSIEYVWEGSQEELECWNKLLTLSACAPKLISTYISQDKLW